MVDINTLRKSNFYTDIVTEAYSNGEGEAVSVSTMDKRVVSASGWISCKCNIDESMGVKIISPEGIRRARNIEELEDSTMAYYIDFRNAEILFTKDLIGKTIYYEYYGTGVDRLCVNRIYTDLDNYGNILMTLEDMTNKYVQILNYLEGIENLDAKLNELKISIKSSDISIDELAESMLIANTSKNNLEKTISNADKTNETLNEANISSVSTLNKLSDQNDIAKNITIPSLTELNNDGKYNISVLDGDTGLIKQSEKKISDMNSKISDSLAHEERLNVLINDSIIHEENLNELINTATSKKESLQNTIDDSVIKNENLTTLISTSETNLSDLTTQNSNATTNIANLNSANSTATTTLNNLNSAISAGNFIPKNNLAIMEEIDGLDIRTCLTKNGTYVGANCINAPRQSAFFVYTVNIYRKSKIIKANVLNGFEEYTTYCNNDIWAETWKKTKYEE